jgi:hypothetical protein
MVSLTGGSDNPDFKVLGVITDGNGGPAPNTRVMLIPCSYNPVTDSVPFAAMVDTTDGDGRYGFTITRKGDYNIQAVHLFQRTRLFISGISVCSDTTRIAAAPLSVPGGVKVMLPSGINGSTGYVYFPGMVSLVFLNNRTDFVVLDSVPAGTIPAVYYASTNSQESTVIRYDVTVAPGDTAVVYNPSWKYARRLVLNTSSAGADVSGSVVNFPVLIRLNQGAFDFSQALAGGADIRFTKPDNTFLPYETERWDPVAGRAEVWVRVDTVLGSDSAQFIVMYWGNPDAADSSNGAAVFDTARGFQGVWHLSEPGNATAYDATGNHYDGTPSGITAASSVRGAIGLSQQFDGTSSYLTMPNTANSRLDFSENGYYTVSAWINADTLDAKYHGILYKSNFQYGLQIRPSNKWEFFEYKNGQGWEGTDDSAAAGSWYNITGVRRGAEQYLYVNGVCIDTAIALVSYPGPRITDVDVQIGHCPDGGMEPDRYFSGIIDEVRISSVANGADWIKLCYMNQKEQDALVKW